MGLTERVHSLEQALQAKDAQIREASQRLTDSTKESAELLELKRKLHQETQSNERT